MKIHSCEALVRATNLATSLCERISRLGIEVSLLSLIILCSVTLTIFGFTLLPDYSTIKPMGSYSQ